MNLNWIKSKSFLVPTLAWALFMAVYLTALQSGPTKHSSLVRTLIQWDGQLYLSIARDGYEKFPCNNRPEYICGNGGWFPFYPMVAAAISKLGIPVRLAALATSWLALWLGLLVLYRLVHPTFGERPAMLAILLTLLAPGSFYFLTAFPYSLFMLLAGVSLLLLHKGQWSWLWLPVGCLAVTYPSGSLIALPLVWVLVRDWRTLDRVNRVLITGAVAAIPLALLLYFGYYWLKFDDFWLYVRIQSQDYYAHEMSFPLCVIGKSLTSLPLNSPVSLTVVHALTATAVFFTNRLPRSWLFFLLGIVLFTPTMGTTDCYYRHIVVAFPLYIMMALTADNRLRRWLLPVFAIASIVITWLVLLPAYKAGVLM